jgi:hypothetical protein
MKNRLSSKSSNRNAAANKKSVRQKLGGFDHVLVIQTINQWRLSDWRLTIIMSFTSFETQHSFCKAVNCPRTTLGYTL